MSGQTSSRQKALLLAVQLPTVSDEDHAADLAELGRLVTTLGHEVVGTLSQRRMNVSKGAVLGRGKLHDLAKITEGPGPAGMRYRKPGTHKRDEDVDDEAPESGEEDAGDKFQANLNASLRERLVSRLTEMQTRDYLAQPHLP